jgi:hypothetical protein
MASRIAPGAPMPPPSVGVARPMKMVPSTRKISASGGIITNTTFLGHARQQAEFEVRLASANTKAPTMPTAIRSRCPVRRGQPWDGRFI